MKVILAAINAKYIHSNLAVYSLRAYVNPYYPGVEIAEYTINQQLDDILMDLYKKKPDMLCLSCYIWNLTYVEELVREIKKVFPLLNIWLGGPEVSYDAEAVLKRLPEVTGVMMGEGEETFLELMNYYIEETETDRSQISTEKRLLRDIKGIAYRDGKGSIHKNPWRDVMDLSRVPFVYHQMEDFRNKIIYYETSRGCPFSCSYCLSSIDKCLRFRDMELVKQELQFFIDHEVPQVKFVDRTFNCNHRHAIEIWKFIKKQDRGITNFHFEIAADLLNEEELELIAVMRPGLIQLEIGVQSTNEETIREIRRVMKFEEVARVVNRINENGNVHQHLDLIAGLPYEDYHSFQKSFNDVYALQPEQLQLGFLKVLKGSYMEEKKMHYGLVYKSKPPYEVLYTRWLSYEDVLRLKGVEEMVEVYYNSRQFLATLGTLLSVFESPFAFFEALAGYYEGQGLHLVSHSRVARYEILLAFAKEYDSGRLALYKELLTYDLYLRENAKSRPAFAGEYRTEKEFLHTFYEREAVTHQYLKGYARYDHRQLRKMTHIEKFSYDVMGDGSRCEQYILFDYENRSPLNHQAAVWSIRI